MHLQVSLTFDVSATTSLTDLEEAILTQGRQSMCEALRQAIKWWEQHQRRCPACGREDECSAHVPQKEAQDVKRAVEGHAIKAVATFAIFIQHTAYRIKDMHAGAALPLSFQVGVSDGPLHENY